ncbi:alpha/beta-hydrolase [Bimuria novae-zelandiae CBS 107.79]|uniref:Alpha/beta-hydrolase n=1 Tax=Bimuria novae-zelandiae CBS 107.79 TaxID=1447943 RepID=A0A6A5VY81_9PLEO|nr:alpha/beta-hydrolase [Bimuria novae-zelandiae CBS 107.79]
MACPDCFRGGKAVGEPKGTMENLHGLPTYVATPQGGSASTSTILYLTDAMGLDLVNNKVLADAYASATGLRVLVPDIIPGGPMPASVLDTMDTIMKPVALFDIYDQKLGLAGFCWGGYFSVNLCAHAVVEGGDERLIDAAFAAHPSLLNAPADVVNAVVSWKTSLSLAHAGEDFMLTMAKVEAAEAELREKVGRGEGENGCWYEVKTFKGWRHGFAARAADEAKAQAVEWFKRWL